MSVWDFDLEDVCLPTELVSITAEPATRSLQQVAESIGECTRCRLSTTRTKIVFGSGPEKAKVLFIGEGPGGEEDKSGEPFVGPAGQLLTDIINKTAEKEGLTLKREDVYICNVVKCRPPGNRVPNEDEVHACKDFLIGQIKAVNPEYIVCLGAVAAKALLGPSGRKRMADLRLEQNTWRGIPVQVTYHPSFLLRNPDLENKRQVWEDLKKVFLQVYKAGESVNK